jgi:UDP:flavonoid glycosyltransferase YjiC (YdhE family)
MKFALAGYGTRGDVEPCVAVGRELLRRGHEVRIAVPPDQVGFAESAGLAAVAYGLDTRAWLDVHRDFWTRFFRNFWNIPYLIRLWRELWEPFNQCVEEISPTLTSLAGWADLLFTGLLFEQQAVNVAEYHGIPLATHHIFPVRAKGYFVPTRSAPLRRFAMTVFWWVSRRKQKKAEDAQRRELGLPKTTGRSSRRIVERGWLEIQAYDEVCCPGLAAEWGKWSGLRPFVGTLTMESPTDADEEITSWIAAGTPPIYFGFGSIPVPSPADTLAMIGTVCAQLGERALVCSGWSDYGDVPHLEHVKVVRAVNHTATFPACRAVVHHGGAGSTAAGLRAGVPTLILWFHSDQPYWGGRVKRLKVGTARGFSSITRESLAADLRTILAPQYAVRAREIATRMTKPAASVAKAADLMENLARIRRIG